MVDTENHQDSWLELTEPRQWSRLLYTNPVCFLGSVDSKNQRNVMVVTWLTATNNNGHFVMSLNRRRHTTSVMHQQMNEATTTSNDESRVAANGISKQQRQNPTTAASAPFVEFTLSVPVKGMEELVLAVGGTSGRWGSKFPADQSVDVLDEQSGHTESATAAEKMSDEQRQEEDHVNTNTSRKKRQRQPKFPHGIPGLRAVLLGHTTTTDGTDDRSSRANDLFAVDGTIAHLQCKATRFMEQVVDDDHDLVLAHIVKAFVKTFYWNARQNLFQPQQDDLPPYLTFFGSQTFGHVVVAVASTSSATSQTT